MKHPPTWNPLTDWKPVDVNWIKVDIGKEDLARFTQRSNVKGALQAGGFLALLAVTGTVAYYAFSHAHWVLMAVALYAHGTFYSRFGDALHELSHNTVFASQWLNKSITFLYGLLYWPWNPYFYPLSHQGYHHRYTLHQGSDGEDTPNYVELKWRLIYDLFFRVIHIRELIRNVVRLVTLRPTSRGWRGRGCNLDTWEQFVLHNARPAKRRAVYRFAVISLVAHVVFVAVCVALGLWFLPVPITFAPFYGAAFMSFIASTHQHAGCDANTPDFRRACGTAVLDPFSSFLYWHMEYHTEHHMFAAVPCYNLKAFSDFIADQMPPRERAVARLFRLNRLCREKFGSWQNWRDNYGRFKGF